MGYKAGAGRAREHDVAQLEVVTNAMNLIWGESAQRIVSYVGRKVCDPEKQSFLAHGLKTGCPTGTQI